MDNEKKYNELVGKIKRAYLYAQTNSTKAVLEDILPELKEGKDEKIRKAIYDWIYTRPSQFFDDGFSKEEMLAWLKKQESVGEIVERCKTSWYNEGKIQGQIEGLSDEEKYQQGWHDALEKQGEQNLANSYCQEHCKGFQETGKCFADGDCKAKTIAETVDKVKPKDYSSIDPHFGKTIDKMSADKLKPFDKYEGLTDFERALADICTGYIGEELGWKQYIKDNADILLKIAIKKFNSIQDVPFEQKSAWSEKDEEKFRDVIRLVEQGAPVKSMREHYTNWLKSLKDKYAWKPSDEQLDALQYVYRNSNPLPSDKLGWNSLKTLELMYHDLKKLKE